MEIWPEISLQLPTALEWAGTGPRQSSGVSSEAPMSTQRAVSIPSGMRQQPWTSPGGLEKVHVLR